MKGFGKDSKPKKKLTRNIHKTPSKEEIINHAAQFHVKGNISKASERFGRGEDIGEYRPSGALEIRQAGYEFDKMRKRIIRHLNQRSEMLSGISHDLRTPLTRIKLQLAFIKDK